MLVFCCIVLCLTLNTALALATECTQLERSMCADHFGVAQWYGRFPNRGLGRDDSTVEFFHFFALLYQENYCSHLLHHLLCFHYFPPCSPGCSVSSSVTASLRLCEEALEACLPYARVLYGHTSNGAFPQLFNCSNLGEETYNGDCPAATENNSTTTTSSSIIEPCCSSEDEEYVYLPNASKLYDNYV